MQQWLCWCTDGYLWWYFSAWCLDDWRHSLRVDSVHQPSDCGCQRFAEWMCIGNNCVGILLLLHVQQWVHWLGLCVVQQHHLDDERHLSGSVYWYERTVDRKRRRTVLPDHELW